MRLREALGVRPQGGAIHVAASEALSVSGDSDTFTGTTSGDLEVRVTEASLRAYLTSLI